MTTATARKFGYPRTRVAETRHWLVLARPQQPTFGSLVLAYKGAAEAFHDVPDDAFADLKKAIDGIETLLGAVVRYDKINYLMLMMVDRDVHFHVIPRYEGQRTWGGHTVPDTGWPAPPSP